jgi:hypothetical protein
MYAAIGYIVPEYFRWPGELSPKMGLSFADIPNGLAALTKVPCASRCAPAHMGTCAHGD